MRILIQNVENTIVDGKILECQGHPGLDSTLSAEALAKAEPAHLTAYFASRSPRFIEGEGWAIQ